MIRRIAFALLAATSLPGFAAGGHHAVDDAVLLEPGQCELEGWATRSRARETGLHLGGGCRVGPVEIGAALESARAGGATSSGQSLQLKYAREVASNFRLGVAVAPYWQPGESGVTTLLLATWTHDTISLHANAGRDFGRNATASRYGASAEWAITPQWSAVAERYSEGGDQLARVAARYAPSSAWSVDLGRTFVLRGGASSGWTLGLNFVFDR